MLIDAATNTTRPVWTTPACPECGAQLRQEVHVPDHKARVAAVEVLLREGLGRPAQAEDPTTPTFPETAAGIESMSWQDMQYFAALLFADQIESLVTLGGREAVRERLAGLSDGNRQLLSRGFAELAPA